MAASRIGNRTDIPMTGEGPSPANPRAAINARCAKFRVVDARAIPKLSRR
jgi:hypothetical protein